MTNRDRFGFRPIPLCDGHIHMTHAHPLGDTVQILADTMTWYDCERIAILSLPQLSEEKNDPLQNAKVLYTKSVMNEMYPERTVYAFGNLYHRRDGSDTAQGYLAQAKALWDMGFDGIKIFDGKPKMRKLLGRRLDDPMFDGFYAFLQEHDLPVTMHLGDPPEFWDIDRVSEYALQAGWFCDETYPTLEQMREEALGILDKFPRLRLTMAHFFFLSQDLEACEALLETYPTLCLDLTPGGEMFENFSKRPEDWRAFFLRHADRISLGTDTYNFSLRATLPEYGKDADYVRTNLVRRYLEGTEPFAHPYLGTLVPLGMDEDTLTTIYRGNFIRRMGDARAVSFRAAAEHLHTLRAPITDGTFRYADDERTALELDNFRVMQDYFSK